MKKLILGLLLIFSFSYCNENRHLAQRFDVITLTSSYSKRVFDLTHIQTTEVIREVLTDYEEAFGTDSLRDVSQCMAKNVSGYYTDIKECNIPDDLYAFMRFINPVDKDDKDIILKVTTSFGMALIELTVNALQEIEYEKKNKKRI